MTSNLPLTAAEDRIEWRKSSFSGAQSNCVETGRMVTGGMAVRDSKDPHGPALAFEGEAWQAFVASVQGGGFPR
ncbi:DUF397 domain-containing protein [Kitasatospora kifunensis]|uniref:DUF397 domain-containing protein n=1 Tax=Kitasatospora kifunensis TaxID=58351 RepID=A0A7W7R6F4_KITKI|nr:DUF397 domain-containing protein [Kitasatospora kifunensis]MBB4926229.1 hypothetical protein [Kitasatospora kifunensis]